MADARTHLPADDVSDDVTRRIHSGGLGVALRGLRHAVNVGSDVTCANLLYCRLKSVRYVAYQLCSGTSYFSAYVILN